MRMRLAAGICALATLVSPGAVSAQAVGWAYEYVGGIATATHRNDDGDVVATLTCAPPGGDLIITDSTFGRAARRVTTAAVRIGQLTVSVPASVEGRGRSARVLIPLPQRPPILAGVQPQDEISVTVNEVTHTYGRGSGRQMEEVAYACWQGGT